MYIINFWLPNWLYTLLKYIELSRLKHLLPTLPSQELDYHHASVCMCVYFRSELLKHLTHFAQFDRNLTVLEATHTLSLIFCNL
jgi:hypothetical protein